MTFELHHQKQPELLLPAGSLTHMHYAFAYGADAVYAGQPRYSLRVRNNTFDMETLQQGITDAHAAGKKFYVASNLSPHNDKLRSYMRDMAPIIDMGPDALIMSDPGLIMMVQNEWPKVPIHLSVQANVVNWATVQFWQQRGIERIILSRELSLKEIGEIRQHCPEMELEVFVHGALCIAYSGRCLLSGYMNHRDSNQGACTNSCRWKYQAHPAEETLEGNVQTTVNTFYPETQLKTEQAPPSNQEKIFLLQQENRTDELTPIYEDEHGTYIMNSKDLRAVQHIAELTRLGVQSFKIEGRTKSHYYVARTAQIYRQAIDNAIAGKTFDMTLMDELEKLSNRGYTEGFYRRHPPKEYQDYETGRSTSAHAKFVGSVANPKPRNGLIQIDVKNKFSIGDQLELMNPSGNISFTLENMHGSNGSKISTAPGSGYRVYIEAPEDAKIDSYSLLMKTSAVPFT